MIAYFLSNFLELRTRVQSKTLIAASDTAHPRLDEIYIGAQNELELIKTALKKLYPNEPQREVMHVIASESVAKLEGMPAHLGARGFDDAAKAPPGALALQLQRLQQADPQRTHFRFLLVNGFGSNLGDNLIGLTAWRQVLAVCRAELPSVSFDVLLGWHSDDRLSRQFKGVDGIERVLTQGITLAEMSCYQGVSDTSSLVSLPNYGRVPVVDWYLNWMGVDPERIAAADKRNRVALDDTCRQRVLAGLPPAVGPRILINPKASVALRSMPEVVLLQLVHAVLAAWPTAQVVVLQPVPVEDARVVDVAPLVPDIDHLAALVALVDGLIGVDTFTSHLADATTTPAVTLYTSTAPGVYPYYPLDRGVLVPGAEQLPAWGKPKVTPKTWEGMADAYLAAWQKLDRNDIVSALGQMMAKKTGSPEAYLPEWLPGLPAAKPSLTQCLEVNGVTLELPLHRRTEPLADVHTSAILNAAAQFTVAGDTVVMVGAGALNAILGVAGRVAQQGHVVVMEPRQRLHQLLCGNLVRAGMGHVQTHCVLPEGEGVQLRTLPSWQLYEEAPLLSFANCRQPESVVCWPIDALNLVSLRMLVVTSPFVRFAVLEGARRTLARLRPVVVLSLIALAEVAVFEPFFKSMKYQTRVLEIEISSGASNSVVYGVLLAEADLLE